MPPEDQDLTDEDSDDEELAGPKDVNHLGSRVLRQKAELVFYDHYDDQSQTCTVKIIKDLIYFKKCLLKNLDFYKNMFDFGKMLRFLTNFFSILL